jgi:ribosome biogenesis GTPase A
MLVRCTFRLEEDEHLVLTPFEKNLEVWRQLWRVLERSDVIVQVCWQWTPVCKSQPHLQTRLNRSPAIESFPKQTVW